MHYINKLRNNTEGKQSLLTKPVENKESKKESNVLSYIFMKKKKKYNINFLLWFNLEKEHKGQHIKNLLFHLHGLRISRWLSRLPILDAKDWMEQAGSINRKWRIMKGIRSVRETVLRSADEIAAEEVKRWKKERLKRRAGGKCRKRKVGHRVRKSALADDSAWGRNTPGLM